MVRLRHPGTRRAESDEENPDDRDRGAAAAADDSHREAPVAAHGPDCGAPAAAMGLPDDVLGRGALSPTPSVSPARYLLRSARVAPTLFIAGQEQDASARVRAEDSHVRQPPINPFRIRFRIPLACCPARGSSDRRVAEALPRTSSDAAAPSLPRRDSVAPPEMAKVAEKDEKKCCLCAVDFNILKRPHHCRICGETICKKCSKGKLALTDGDDAPLVRVCDKCLVEKEVVKKCSSCDVDFSLSKRPHQCRNCRGIFCRKCSQGKIALTIDHNAPAVRVCDKCLAEVDRRLKMAKEVVSNSTTIQTLEVAPEIELALVPVMSEVAVNTRRRVQAKASVTRLDHNVTKASDRHVALIYDARMLAHKPEKGKAFYETPERLEWIVQKLKTEGIADRCQIFEPDLATTESLLAVHSTKHVKEVETLSSKSQRELDEIALEHDYSGGTYYCQQSTKAAQVAAGSVIKACDLVASGKFNFSFALVRPPGHHVARDGPPSGFCLLNNVAVGAAHLLEKYQMQKILIVDWDIHHGDGTQDIFYDDKKVLFFSIHRFCEDFFPYTKSGSLDSIGDGDGVGHNINVCFKHPNIRDADYIAVWNYLLLPLIQEFEPEMIIISAGFDAAQGDQLGKCDVTPAGFASLLEKLMPNPIIMALEGGYELSAISDCVAACVKVLLGEKPGNVSKRCRPYDTTWMMIRETRETFKRFWKVYEKEIPEAISSKSKRYR